jgi:hypothetical protein
VFSKRLLGWQLASFVVGVSQFAGFNLAGFDIGLIERINPQKCTRNSGCQFPTEKFLRDLPCMVQRNGNNRLACINQRSNGFILLMPVFRGQTQINEQTVEP